MPTPLKRPRLWLRPARRDKRTKRITGQAVWIILDNGKHIPTGCSQGEVEAADRALSDYIAAQYRPHRTERDIEAIEIADVLMIYLEDVGPKQVDLKKLEQRVGRLNEFWGNKKLSEISTDTCRGYERERGTAAGARRELEDLRSAINHHKARGLHRGEVVVTLPDRGEPRDRWLTRSEAAKLLWACWRTREVQRGVETAKYPLRHIARFILIGLYTGTRASPIAAASPYPKEGRSYVDLERGVFYRLQIGKKKTKKRQHPAPIPPRLLAHMRRWKRLGIAKEYFVEYKGRPVLSVKTGFQSAVTKAKIAHCSPHTLRHTAATWMMQNGAPTWQAAGFLAMSPETLERVYGHHHPDYMEEAVQAITGPRQRRARVIPLAGRKAV